MRRFPNALSARIESNRQGGLPLFLEGERDFTAENAERKRKD
jgi:hypothetical protein